MNCSAQDNKQGQEQLKRAFALCSLALATYMQVWLGALLVPNVANPEPTRITNPGHIDAVYEGLVLSHCQDHLTSVSFDPNFNAGASIPVATDGRGRLVSALTRIFGRSMSTDQYRLSIQIFPAIVPFLLVFAVRAAGASLIAAGIAPWLTIAVWAMRTNQRLFLAGYCELILIGPLVAVYLSSLYGYHRRGSFLNWTGLVLASLVGWLIAPVPWAVVSILGAICWLLVAHRHDFTWNGLAVLSFLIGVSPALPPVIETLAKPDVLAQINPMNMTNWLTPSSHSNPPIDMTGFFPAIAGIALGVVRRFLLRAQRSSAAEWLFGCTLAGLAIGMILQQNSFISTATFEAIGLWAAFLLVAPVSIWLAPTCSWFGMLNVVVIASGVAFAALRMPVVGSGTEAPAWGFQQFSYGWSPEDNAWRNELRSVVSPTARVLWERLPTDRFSPSMLPLDFRVSVLTGRGMDSDDQPWTFANGYLGGRAIGDWSDEDLNRFCDRWNIGWIRTASAESQRRVRKWPLAKAWEPTKTPKLEMFSIDRPQTYFLRGQGVVELTAPNQIVLSDVKPVSGEVVLSYCWHPGWTTAPSHVGIEPDSNAFEPVPLIRLRTQVPITRLVLRWTGR